MTTTPKPEKFNALVVQLHGSNLIEASAGTGKTYSIAIMVLRLLLEKSIAINEILMVTFTRAAVAELEERVRKFVRSAYKASTGEAINDEAIAGIVKEAINSSSQATVQQVLRTAILFLDETSVLTIHSFCQQTLASFAFETKQLFGTETLQDTSSVITDEVNKFWRQNITTMPVELLQHIVDYSFTRQSITYIVKEHLDGKEYEGYEAAKNYDLDDGEYQTIQAGIKQLEQDEERLRTCLYEHVEKNRQQITDAARGNAYVSKNILPAIDDPEEFISSIWEKRDKANVLKVFETTLLPKIKECDEALQQRNRHMQEVLTKLNFFAINKIAAGINEYKQRNNLLSFDDMIVNLHRALMHDKSDTLTAAIRKKYKAVFIDEFQDTDRLQYEIFEKAFGSETILFYIGDPKQSIYAWRKADIFTYFKAYSGVSKRYNMNQNFRSSEALIHAMNQFFLPVPGFDTFFFQQSENAIKYIPVESPKPDKKGELLRGNVPEIPVTILQLSNNEAVANAVAQQVLHVLTAGEYTILLNWQKKAVTPADIGILVRTNGQAHIIKEALSAKGIPAVTINDAKVLQSPEAVFMLYLLQAVTALTPAAINKALLSPFTGYKVADVQQLDDEKVMELFRTYVATWRDDGVYAMLIEFAADYNIRSVLLGNHTETGERIITNFFQMTELLHKVQNDKHFSDTELAGWLQRSIEGMQTEGDMYEQRIESDEEAIKIVTIHKSKGLEYNIVMAPFLDFMIERKNATFTSFRDPASGNYVTIEKDRLGTRQKQWVDEQTEQENRRLLYVAVTRAVYKCFIFQNTYYKNSTLSTFINALPAGADGLIAFAEMPAVTGFYKKTEHWEPCTRTQQVDFKLLQNNWSRMSYTMLAAKTEHSIRYTPCLLANKYDQFIFNQLTRGPKTGNMLHYLFENIDFANRQLWQYQVAQSIRRFAPRHEEAYTAMLSQMLEHVTQATITAGSNTFSLSQVASANRLNELEFDFNVPVFSPAMLHSLGNSGTGISIKYFEQAEGIMNGKVDMFFEHKDKYYILDWKSNFLGNDVKDYHPHLLHETMSQNNYHLQYLIYTVAIKKYLQQRLPGFSYQKHFGGIIYMFVRGVRSTSGSGIFITQPAADTIEMLEKMVSR